jgi:phenylalanine-4-hydroxylase
MNTEIEKLEQRIRNKAANLRRKELAKFFAPVLAIANRFDVETERGNWASSEIQALWDKIVTKACEIAEGEAVDAFLGRVDELEKQVEELKDSVQ